MRSAHLNANGKKRKKKIQQYRKKAEFQPTTKLLL